MSKELEAFETVYNNFDYLISDVGIENDDVNICLKTIKEQLPTIKQALLKAQENARSEEILQKYYQDGITLDSVRALKKENELLKAKAQKEHKALDLLMQELDCKDFAELRKYARCGKHTLSNLKGSQYDNIMVDEFKPKHYLKWEDLKFEHTPKMFDVNMNDNKYRLVVGYNVAGNNLVILRNDKQQYYFLEADKQFFNDLHLYRC